jgi:hypothetical protein
MTDPYWFQKKWKIHQVPIDNIKERLLELEEKYSGALEDIKRLEEENLETKNILYELMNSIDAVDNRIDILAEHCRITEDV